MVAEELGQLTARTPRILQQVAVVVVDVHRHPALAGGHHRGHATDVIDVAVRGQQGDGPQVQLGQAGQRGFGLRRCIDEDALAPGPCGATIQALVRASHKTSGSRSTRPTLPARVEGLGHGSNRGVGLDVIEGVGRARDQLGH